MKINHNNHTIVVKPSGKAAHVAQIFNKEGALLKEIFTLYGAESALQGAKNRLFNHKTTMFTKLKNIFQ